MKPHERDPVADRLLRGLEPPQPPPALRAKTLAAARDWIAIGAAPDVWSRIWNHHRLRMAWAASVVLLLAGHVLVTLSPVGPMATVDPALVADNGVDEYIIGMLRPIRISENVQPMVGLVADSDDLTALDLKGNPS
jgi:hypothetical protein